MARAVRHGIAPSEYARMTPGTFKPLLAELDKMHAAEMKGQYEFWQATVVAAVKAILQNANQNTSALLKGLAQVARRL